MNQLKRVQSTPVLTKGGSYGGWDADALAAPAVCYDGTQYVMTVSLWSVANSEWASAFFTSTDLVSWSYVTGSLQAPTGSDYILGNAGLAWWGGKYWFAFNAYATTPAGGIDVWSSDDLVTWDVEATAIGPDYAADPQLSVNPDTGKLECLYIDSARDMGYLDTSNGTSWTDQGIIHEAPFWCPLNFGEGTIYYDTAGTIWMLHDGAYTAGERYLALAWSVDDKATWLTNSTAMMPSPVNSWEGVNVFDAAFVGKVNVGDGAKVYVLYAGSAIAAATDNTESSIGLAWMDDPVIPTL